MSTAQAFYEIYKSLPKKTRKEVLELLQDEMVMISRSAVTEAADEGSVQSTVSGVESVVKINE